MTTIAFRQPAPQGSRFAPGCFDSWVGRRVPFRVMDRWVDDCLIVSAQLAEDGGAVSLTVEMPDESVPRAPIPGGSLRLAEEEQR